MLSQRPKRLGRSRPTPGSTLKTSCQTSLLHWLRSTSKRPTDPSGGTSARFLPPFTTWRAATGNCRTGIRFFGPRRSGGTPLPLAYEVPGSAPCWIGSLFRTTNSVPRRLSFLVPHPRPVCFGTAVPIICIAAAYRLPQPSQPETRPRELDAEYGEPYRNNHDSRPRRNDHHHADQENRNAYYGHDDAPGSLVRQMHNSPDQNLPHSILDFAEPYRSLSTMRPQKIPLLLAILFCAPAIVSAETALTVLAIEATSQIERRDKDHQRTRLPSLELTLRAAFTCPADTTADSMTVSISDTHRRYDFDKDTETRSLEASLRVPAEQIAPVTAPDFCVKDGPVDDQGLLLPGIATAQVSLRCRNEADISSVHFASVVIPLRLHCQADHNQDSPSDRWRSRKSRVRRHASVAASSS